jgi:hypothetical protein
MIPPIGAEGRRKSLPEPDRFSGRLHGAGSGPREPSFVDASQLVVINNQLHLGGPAFSTIEATAAKIASPAPAAVVARKQRRPSDESGDVAATDAVAARVAAIVIAARRVAPTCVRVIIAIVVIVVPRRGGGGDYSREQSLPGYRPSGLSTRNPGNPDWGRGSIDARLGAFDSQRNSAMFRPTERQQRPTRNGKGCDCGSF